jgi:type II secretory pathway component PulC
METKTRRARWLVWISVSAAAGLIFYYFYASRSQVDPSPAPAATPDAKSSDLSFSGRPTLTEAAPVVKKGPIPQAPTSESKLAVNGVMITTAARTALISVDDRPAAPFVEGQQIVAGVVLYAVNPDRIVVKRGGDLVRLPVRGAQSPGSAGSELPDGGAGPASTDPPPPGTEEEVRRRDSD